VVLLTGNAPSPVVTIRSNHAIVKSPSWQLTDLLRRFLRSESKSGFILIAAPCCRCCWPTPPSAKPMSHFWHIPVEGSHTVEHVINDGLMTLFFLLVGLEIEREIYQGELSDIRAALLPLFAAWAAWPARR
jgi:NhaA family Na+:H+ antiporter